MASNPQREYTPPAIDERIHELLDRRQGAGETLSTETTREQLVNITPCMLKSNSQQFTNLIVLFLEKI